MGGVQRIQFYKMTQQTAKILIVIGALIVVLGIVFYFFGDKLNWLGRLPGDIRIERENGGFYFPITTCILVSLLITAILKIIQWLR
jgi:hypothetical protein